MIHPAHAYNQARKAIKIAEALRDAPSLSVSFKAAALRAIPLDDPTWKAIAELAGYSELSDQTKAQVRAHMDHWAGQEAQS